MASPLAPVPVEGPLTEEEVELFGEYSQLVPIVVQGEILPVPEKNSVLRALQYLELRSQAVRMDWGRYCWNNTKGCCEMIYRVGDQEPQLGRACQVEACAGLEILELPKGGRKP